MVDHSNSEIRRVGIKVHPLYTPAEKALKEFNATADRLGIEIVDPCDETCQAVVSIGGDGTLLSAVHDAYPHNIPVWGINVGDLGYLTTSGTDNIAQETERLARGDFFVEHRTMMEAAIHLKDTEKITLIALNDIVIHRHVPGGGLMMLDAELDGRFLATFEADGLIISTPTGSTGYNLAAGGSILSPHLHGFILTPICAHSFSARSLIFDDSSTLVIRSRLKMPGEVAFATADGQNVAELKNCPGRLETEPSDGCKITIKSADRPAGLLRFDEVYFSDVLRDKLGWAERSPNTKS